jgi:hypothetical protein
MHEPQIARSRVALGVTPRVSGVMASTICSHSFWLLAKRGRLLGVSTWRRSRLLAHARATASVHIGAVRLPQATARPCRRMREVRQHTRTPLRFHSVAWTPRHATPSVAGSRSPTTAAHRSAIFASSASRPPGQPLTPYRPRGVRLLDPPAKSERIRYATEFVHPTGSQLRVIGEASAELKRRDRRGGLLHEYSYAA